jgi:PAS domain S-box-containing protein
MMAHVLVVSHEVDTDGVLSKALRKVGHTVTVVPDLDKLNHGSEAADADVVVAGLVEPRSDVEALVGVIRSMVPQAQVIAVADDPNPFPPRDAVGSGLFDVLSRPVPEERLIRDVANAAALKQAQEDGHRLREENRDFRENLARLVDEQAEELSKREARFREYVENAPTAVLVVNEVGELVDVNAATERMTGFSRSELLKKNVLEIAPPESRERLRDDFQTLVQTGSVESESSHLTKNGNIRAFLVHAVRISGDRFLGFATDITAQKRAEAGLERSRQRLRTIMDAVPSMIFVKNADGRFLAANQALADSVGMNVKEVVGRRLSEVGTDPGDVQRMLEQDRRVLESGESLDIPVEPIHLQSGETRWFRSVKVPYSESDFGEPAVLGVSMDITDRVEAEEDLERNYETQRLLKTLMEVSVEGRPLGEALGRSLDLLLSSSSISLAPQGGILLTESGGLRLEVHRNMPSALISECDRVGYGECLCGRAAQTGVIQFADCVDDRHQIRYEGISEHGHYCVPIMHREEVLGVILLFLEHGHVRSEREVEFLHAAAHTLAGLIARKRAEELQLGQRRILELISSGDAPLPEVLAAITKVAEANVSGVRSTILLLEGRTIRRGSGPSMPEEYNALLDGLEIGPAAGSCGTAMHRAERVIVEDVAVDPLWADYREFGEKYGFRACWSEPILSSDGAVQGTFALYREVPGRPTGGEITLVESMAHLAGLAIERTRTEMKLKKLGSAIEQSPASIFITDSTGDIEYVNPGFCSMMGYSPEEVVGRNPRILQSGHTPDSTYEELWATVLKGGEWRGEWANKRKNGDLCWQRVSISAVLGEGGEITNFLCVAEDITERKSLELEKTELEGQLLQSQRMETIGTLAGGIAHDFNNVLTPIMGYSQLAQERLEGDNPLHEDLEGILGAARRAKELVEQILLFSRPTSRGQKPVKIQDVVEEAVRLLRATIPSTINIRVTTDPGCDRVMADSSQIHQVVLNLCTNAFQAMEKAGGSLVLELEQVMASEKVAKVYPALSEKECVRLTVRDSGPGMDDDTRERVFEPFFTTRSVGKGTGLGLSVVHGIVKTHGGAILVESAVGEGTEFQVYLPVTSQVGRVEGSLPDHIEGGTESILVVDDDSAVAEVVSRMLRRLGYDVTTFTDSVHALENIQEDPDRYHLVLSDLTMPKMTGLGLASELRRVSPQTAMLIMTGYGEEMGSVPSPTRDLPTVLAKPVEVGELARAVRRALGQA